MKESVVKNALTRFKKNAGSYFAVGILCGLFLALLALLSFIDIVVFVATIPFLALPFIFACHISCYYLEASQPITVSSFWRYFFGYFRPQFRGCFRGIRSFLLSLAFYLAGLVATYLILYAVFRAHYGVVFTDAMNDLATRYMSNEYTYEELYFLLEENGNLLLTFITYVSSFPVIVAVTYFMSSILYASLSIYYRTNVVGAVPSLIRLAINNTYSIHRHTIKKDWLKLNWPLLLLPLLGGVLGATIYFLVVKDINLLFPIMTIAAVTPLMFFLPFYFANMEILYHRYQNAFKEGNKMAVETILARIQNSIELSEEERRSLEESFKSENDKEE